jgi:hypothetical protein
LEADLVFFNVNHFGERLREAIRAAKSPVEWVILDASPINWIDATALQHFDELAAWGIVFGIARASLSLNRASNLRWLAQRRAAMGFRGSPTLKAAAHTFERRNAGAEDVQAAEHPSPVGSEADEPICWAVDGATVDEWLDRPWGAQLVASGSSLALLRLMAQVTGLQR